MKQKSIAEKMIGNWKPDVPGGHFINSERWRYVYWFHGINWCTFMVGVDELQENFPMLADTVEFVKQKFREAGWKSDGSLQLLWLPSFIFPEDYDISGVMLFHAAQYDTGISYIASTFPLPFPALLRQNDC